MTKKVVKYLIYCKNLTCGYVQEVEEATLICPECGGGATFEVFVQEVEDNIEPPSMTRFDPEPDGR